MTEPLWLCKNDAAKLVGLKPRRFDEVIKPMLAAEDKREGAKQHWFYAPAVHDVDLRRKLHESEAKVRSASSDDPLLAGGADSPGLERYRLAKAALAERDLAERESSIVRVSVIKDVLLPAVTGMRATGEKLGRRFGNEAVAMFNEGVDECEANAMRLLKSTEKSD